MADARIHYALDKILSINDWHCTSCQDADRRASDIELEYLNLFLGKKAHPDIIAMLSRVNTLHMNGQMLLGMRRCGDLSTIVQCHYTVWDSMNMVAIGRTNSDEYACLLEYSSSCPPCVVLVDGSAFDDPDCVVAESIASYFDLLYESIVRDISLLEDSHLVNKCSPRLGDVSRATGLRLP